MIDAIVMAGGRSARMRAGGNATHKALVSLAGIPLAEYSVRALLSAGFHRLAIAVSAAEGDLRRYAEVTLQPLVERSDATLEVIVESEPLGTIGAVRCLDHPASSLLVVNVDNVSALDLRALVDEHMRGDAAFTIATHREHIRDPFGVLRLDGNDVVGYVEKPVRSVRISSGTYVLSGAAIDLISPGEAIGVPQLFDRVRAAGLRTSAYRHNAPWVDVNDNHALERAHAMLQQAQIASTSAATSALPSTQGCMASASARAVRERSRTARVASRS